MHEVSAPVRGAAGDVILIDGKGGVISLLQDLVEERTRRAEAELYYVAIHPLGVQEGAQEGGSRVPLRGIEVEWHPTRIWVEYQLCVVATQRPGEVVVACAEDGKQVGVAQVPLDQRRVTYGKSMRCHGGGAAKGVPVK